MTIETTAFAGLSANPSAKNAMPIFENGDVALLLKKDGSVRTMSFGPTPDLETKQVEDLSADEIAMLEQGEKLLALTLALGNPQIMNVLLAIAADPDIIQRDNLVQFFRPN